MSFEKQNPKKIKNTHEVLFQADFVILGKNKTFIQQLKKISYLCICEQLKWQLLEKAVLSVYLFIYYKMIQ